MKRYPFILGLLVLSAAACNNPQPDNNTEKTIPADTTAQVAVRDTSPVEKDTAMVSPETKDAQNPEKTVQKQDANQAEAATPPDQGSSGNKNFQAVTDLDASILLDIRYATANNFTKAKIYDCPACLLRPAAAAALVKVHKSLKIKGYGGLKMFDCYRPRPYQQRLWDKVPNANYVTPPAKGSMHSRGAAVDLTIVDRNGKELDMGTPYDFFGRAAHTDYTQLPVAVLANRRLLQKEMEAAGFAGIRTEWWHFSFRKGNYALSDFLWQCE